jgi:hypothetical protein
MPARFFGLPIYQHARSFFDREIVLDIPIDPNAFDDLPVGVRRREGGQIR